jgi:hypothetical protein
MSNETDAQRLAAALEQLEMEKRRRQDEKVAAGLAVRVPNNIPVVVREDEDVDTAIERLKAREIEKLRANDEKREIVFEEFLVIDTGVPGRGREFGGCRGSPLQSQYPNRYAPLRPRVVADPPAPTASEWKPFRLTVTPPSERDMGMIIEARYQLAGGNLRLDFQGRIYAEPIGPSDDPLVVARRLLRSKYGHSEFYSPIDYGPRSYH